MDSAEESNAAILLVEDDANLAFVLRQFFGHGSAYRVDWVDRGDDAIDQILAGDYAVVILDLGLPVVSGYEVCRRVRDEGYPGYIMILTGQTEDAAQLSCLELGADDYITKPSSPKIILARIQALLRRANRGGKRIIRVGKGPLEIGVAPIRAGDLTIDPATGAVELGDRRITLSTTELDLLLVLATRLGQAVSRDELHAILVGEEWNGKDRRVDMLVMRLRRKLGDDPKNPKRIETIRGEGYQLSAGK